MFRKQLQGSWTTILLVALFLIAGLFVGCGGDGEADNYDEADQSEPVEGGDEVAADDGAPSVFFTNLSDGDEVEGPVVTLEFDVSNFEIVAAADPPVVEDGKGHHHLAINGHCLPAGEVIEKADPWVHFGDGSNTIDVQLPLGDVHLSLQVGDGEHRTLDEPGLCLMIDLTVVEGGGDEGDGEGE